MVTAPSNLHMHSPQSLSYTTSPTTPTSRTGDCFAPLGADTNGTCAGVELHHFTISPILHSQTSIRKFSPRPDTKSPHRCSPVSPQEINHLTWFFSMNLLSQVPIITAEDMRDLTALSWASSPLAISMAYVAAHFVPGCKALRSRLADAVVDLTTICTDAATDTTTDDERWNLLQALAVLYTWGPSHAVQDHRVELTREMLKVSIDSLIARYTMYRSAQEVAEALYQNTHPGVCNAFFFRKYLYWLWWYTESHSQSLFSRTPSRMREDATIMHASDILRPVVADKRVHQIVARVELCLIWFRAGLRERHFGEWYCATPNNLSPEEALHALKQIDSNLQLWRQRYHAPAQPQPHVEALAESTLELYQHCLHFCNVVYTAQALTASSLAGSKPSVLEELELGALDRAWSLCDSFRNLNPLSKSAIGYSSEAYFIMIAFCCDYIIQVASSRPNPRWSKSIAIVSEVAQLMCEVSSDKTHSAHVIGQRIMDSYMHTKDETPRQCQQNRASSPQYRGVDRQSFQRQPASSTELPFTSSYETSSSGASTNPSPELHTLSTYSLPVSASKVSSLSWANHEAALNTNFDLAARPGDPYNLTTRSDAAFDLSSNVLTEDVGLAQTSLELHSSSAPFWMQDPTLDPDAAFF